ncbi:MAG: sugar ABC transporter substrate-binding protein [Planctomycetaceae bacterium]|nr:sugar ABC transporter substrate-binding protein [Planctomycetaceae bacterium]
MKKRAILAVALVACGLLAATPVFGGEKKVRIGFSLKTVNNPFVISVKNGAAKAAADLGADIIITDSQMNSQKQMQDIESFVQQRVDVVLIDAMDSQAILPTIDDAVEAGMKIVTEDVRIPDAGDKVLSHIGIDNHAAGAQLARWLAAKLKAAGKRNVIIIAGIPGNEATDSRANGYREVLLNNPDIDVLDTRLAGDKREEGLTVMDDMLQRFAQIDGVICSNDELALGAISAISESGRADDILVCGFDGNKYALEAIKSGDMAATIDHAPYSMGYLAIETCVKAAQGQPVDKLTVMEVEVVDSTNVDATIAKHADEE